MKKRFFALALLLIMMLGTIPATTLSVSAEDTQYTPPAEYTKYKDLWFDEGHLITFIDVTKLNTAGAVAKTSDAVTDYSAFNGARLLTGTVLKGTESSKDHYFVRSIGGKNAGMYYMLAEEDGKINKDNPAVCQVDENGLIDFCLSGSVWGQGAGGIYYGYAFTQEQVKTQSLVSDAKSTEGVTKTAGLVPTSDPIYDGTYGNFTVDIQAITAYGSYDTMIGTQYKGESYYPSLLYFSTKGQISFKVDGVTRKIIKIGAGGNTDDSRNGQNKKAEFAGKTGVHSCADFTFDTATTFTSFQRVIAEKMYKTTDAVPVSFPVNNSQKSIVKMSGFGVMYVRVYDKILDDFEMKQNHFADLCYYYGLENTEMLVSLGSYVLTETFYNKFMTYSVGTSNAIQIQEMQQAIDKAITNATSVADVKTLAAANYESVSANAEIIKNAKNSVAAVVSSITDCITEVTASPAVTADAQTIIDTNVANLNKIKNNVSAYLDILTEYATFADSALSTATPASNTAKTATTVADACTQNNIIYSSKYKMNENAKKALYAKELADKAAGNVSAIVSYVASVNANVSTDITEYVALAGYQIRNLDYAAMRAVFVYDTAKIKNGYSYKTQKYDIVAYGVICAPSSGNVEDITVEYSDGNVTTSVKGAFIEMPEARYALEEELADKACEKAKIDGDAYATVKSFELTKQSNLSSEYQKEYVFRVFMVFEGENTSYIKYFDAVSTNLGATVSLYRLAKYIEPTADELTMMENHTIPQVIYAVDGDK